MGTVTENRKEQQYRSKGPSCKNCKNHSTAEGGVRNEWTKEIIPGTEVTENVCKVGHFKTSPEGWCKLHAFK